MFESESVQAIILGVIQGLTEFLPVSSSGHLELAKYVMGDHSVGKQSMLMTVVLHFATALSTVIVFRHELITLFRGLFGLSVDSPTNKEPLKKESNATVKRGALTQRDEFWFCVKIVISMVPAALVGVLLEDQIETLFAGRLLLVGVMLIVTGGLLLLADRAKVTENKVGFWDAVSIGIAQAVAILPGVSRSGATISTSVLLGVDRERAARFSFLMVVPLIFGKMGYDVLKTVMGEADLFADTNVLALSLGFAAALITGIFACHWMIRLVKACQLYWFSLYCFVVAALAIAESQLQWLS
ncbi:MAG: undecaprenyl-diphosphate phosphatase [Planctomycetota bacterium]